MLCFFQELCCPELKHIKEKSVPKEDFISLQNNLQNQIDDNCPDSTCPAGHGSVAGNRTPASGKQI